MAKDTQEMPFDCDRWLGDGKLSDCDEATRGIWIDWLAFMWRENGRTGMLVGTLAYLAKKGRTTEAGASHAISDLQKTGAANVTDSNGTYTIINRKMKRTYDKRNNNAVRQEKWRAAASSVELDADQEADFERFWAAFPGGRKKSKAPARVAFLKALVRSDAEIIIASAAEYALSEAGMSKWVKMPSSWLNQDCWADDRTAWQDRDKERTYSRVSAAQFRALYDAGKFSAEYPQRDKTNPKRVFGKLRDNREIECTDYPLPQQKEQRPDEPTD